MKVTNRKSIVRPIIGENDYKAKVTSLCYSPDNSRLAIATADRFISVFNEKGECVDKFITKPNNNGPKDYSIA